MLFLLLDDGEIKHQKESCMYKEHGDDLTRISHKLIIKAGPATGKWVFFVDMRRKGCRLCWLLLRRLLLGESLPAINIGVGICVCVHVCVVAAAAAALHDVEPDMSGGRMVVHGCWVMQGAQAHLL